MKEKLQKIREDAIRQIEASGDLSKLNDVRVAVLGKKGELTAVLKSMKDVSPEERPLVGQLVNETRESIEKILDETKKKLEAAELDAKLRREVIDVTLPAKKNNVGHRHPNTIALEEVERIFTGMGYEVVEGPEVGRYNKQSRKLLSPRRQQFFIHQKVRREADLDLKNRRFLQPFLQSSSAEKSLEGTCKSQNLRYNDRCDFCVAEKFNRWKIEGKRNKKVESWHRAMMC